MINTIVLTIVIISFILASIEDIRKREVYDYINYSFAFLIITIGIFHSLTIKSFDPIKYIGFGLLVGFAIGSILYYGGIWGGGDAKFLIGFSASVYYLMDYIKPDTQIQNIYNYFIYIFANTFNTILNISIKLIILLNVISLVIILIRMFLTKYKHEIKDLFTLFAILSFLFIGIYFNYNTFYMILLGFLSFLLIFFADEEVFSSVYLKTKKNILSLEKGNRIDSNITHNNKTIIPFAEAKYGLTKEDIHKIKENIKTDKIIKVRNVLPYSILVALNYIIYILKIIKLDNINIEILGFLFKFLFYSFCAGGIIAILLLLGYYLKNIKKIKIKLNKYEKLITFIYVIITILLGIINIKYTIIVALLLVYYLIKVAKQIEKLMFVKKKNLDKITLGDWVVQDIKIENKIIYDATDFKLGIEEKQLKKIKKLAKNHKELKSLYVKDGLAFIPPLFIGFILMFIL